MDYRLPALTAALLAAAFGIAKGVSHGNSQADATPAPPEIVAGNTGNAGSQMISEAINQLSSHQTISAKVRHRTQLFEQRLVGSGIYLQKRSEPDPLVRFSLSIQAGERAITLLNICDGRFLWIRENFEPPGSLSRIDLRRVRDSTDLNGPANMMGPTMLGGGLVQLLQSLRENFEFADPYPLTFQNVPVWAIACRWKTNRLAALLPKKHLLLDSQGRIRVDELPAQIPDRVLLLLGQEHLFPYHIDFRRSRSGDKAKQESRSLVTMELFEVQFDEPVKPTHFIYKPGDIEITDGTDDYLARRRKVVRSLRDR